MSEENKDIAERVGDMIKKRNKDKNENYRSEQFNLKIEEETPESTIKKARRSKPRGSKPKEQNLSNQEQLNIKSDSSVLDGIKEMREKIQENIKEDENFKNKNDKETRDSNNKSKIERVKRRVNLLRK